MHAAHYVGYYCFERAVAWTILAWECERLWDAIFDIEDLDQVSIHRRRDFIRLALSEWFPKYLRDLGEELDPVAYERYLKWTTRVERWRGTELRK